MNNRVIRRGYQFVDQRWRRFAMLKVRPYGSDWNLCEHERSTPELGRACTTECMPGKAHQTGLVPLRLITHATFESGRPIPLHEIMTTVE